MSEPTKENIPAPTQAPKADTSPKGVFGRAVKERINGDKKHGWGVDDSMHVIRKLWEDNTGEPLDDAYAEQVKRVVNPSAFRQQLEDAGVLEKAPRKIKGDLAALVG